MKRIFIHALSLVALSAVALTGTLSAQDRTRTARRITIPQEKPAATPSPTPAPATTIAETPLQPGQRARFDDTNYHIIAELNPQQHLLTASADVTFTPTENTRTVVFELNGSLKVESVRSEEHTSE